MRMTNPNIKTLYTSCVDANPDFGMRNVNNL